MKAVIIYIIFFSILHVSSFAQHNQYTSTKFAVKNPYEVFIGGIMKANDVNGLHQLLNVPMNPTSNPQLSSSASFLRLNVLSSLN